MWELSCAARAKINLSLDVGQRRPDGYHELCTVMHSISLADRVSLSRRPAGEICVRTSVPSLPTGADNLAGRAVQAFCRHTGLTLGAEIYIEKNIPSEAGLGGGSADAAAVLRMLCSLFELPVGQLMPAAATLGADVPFCLAEGCALCRGIGERLQPLPPMPACHILVAKPDVGAPTGRIFAEFDREPDLRCHSPAVCDALHARDGAALRSALGNGLAAACYRVAPGAAHTVPRLHALGAEGACLSGSGTAAYGLFSDGDTAARAARALEQEGYFTALCRPAE